MTYTAIRPCKVDFLLSHQRLFHLRNAASTVVIVLQAMTCPPGVLRVESDWSAEIARLVLYFILLNIIMCTHPQAHMHTHLHTHAHTHMHTHLHTHAHTHMPTHPHTHHTR